MEEEDKVISDKARLTHGSKEEEEEEEKEKQEELSRSPSFSFSDQFRALLFKSATYQV